MHVGHMSPLVSQIRVQRNRAAGEESIKVRFELSIFNLFNSSIVRNKDQTILHPDGGQLQFAHDADIFKGFNTAALMKAQNMRTSPLYGLANGFQGPRNTRLQLTFFFPEAGS
jgi:hypothetical protein